MEYSRDLHKKRVAALIECRDGYNEVISVLKESPPDTDFEYQFEANQIKAIKVKSNEASTLFYDAYRSLQTTFILSVFFVCIFLVPYHATNKRPFVCRRIVVSSLIVVRNSTKQISVCLYFYSSP